MRLSKTKVIHRLTSFDIFVSIVQEKRRENYYLSAVLFYWYAKTIMKQPKHMIYESPSAITNYWYAEKIKMVKLDLKKVSSQKNIYFFERLSRYNDPTFYEKKISLHNPFN